MIVVADRPPERLRAGRELDSTCTSSATCARPSSPADVEARLTWTGGERTWRWSGVVPADACERVGRVRTRVPEAPGPLSLELCCRFGDEVVENRYDATIDV